MLKPGRLYRAKSRSVFPLTIYFYSPEGRFDYEYFYENDNHCEDNDIVMFLEEHKNTSLPFKVLYRNIIGFLDDYVLLEEIEEYQICQISK